MVHRYTTLLLDLEESIATITLNRPEKLNALNGQMREELAQALEEVQGSGARVLILTGAGRGFCSGADISEFAVARGEEEPPREDPRSRLQRPLGWLALRLNALELPTLAAVNGVAAGAGLSLALACDLRLAAQSARFSAIFVKRGLMPDYGCTWLLPRIVGLSRALELMYTGRMVNAPEAKDLGLVDRVVPDADLMTEARSLAREIAQGAPVALELVKKATYRGYTATLEAQLLFEAYGQDLCRTTEDYREGVRAFLEKREPVFKGR